ncbi:MAG: flagellin [Desulfobacteraceae bacterium]|nr:MAG: flagellin [Desulfobacteraceae bacterium]
MGLRIQNNLAAINAHRQLTISDTALSKSLERLSSGYRINRAADDAAGLAISQGFRADIASFKVAARNASEASSLLQVAEGALDQIGGMLTRLKELATQASSANAGSNLGKIEAEANKLLSEIDRIANTTEYADTALIKGSFGVTYKAATALAVSSGSGFNSITGMAVNENYDITTTVSGTGGTMMLTTGTSSETVYFSVPSGSSTADIFFASVGVTVQVNSSIDSDVDGSFTAGSSGHSSFQVGAENTANDRIAITLGDARNVGLGFGAAGVSLDMSTASNAQSALTSIDTAIGSLATVRGNIGAYMNRLSYASANLLTTVENVTASESVIRDVDMAAEMTNFTKTQILLQAGTAMLAQANMAPQQVLSLFG